MPLAAHVQLADFFASFRQRLAEEARNDVEPKMRFSPEWYAWQKRHWDRERRRIELVEAEALSTYPEDPAPFASEGLHEFLAWCRRQESRRRARRGHAA